MAESTTAVNRSANPFVRFRGSFHSFRVALGAGMTDAEYVAPSDERPWEPPQSCPSCGAPEVVRRQKWVGFATFAAFVFAIAYTQDATLLGFYIVAAAAIFVLVAASWRCRQCGYTW